MDHPYQFTQHPSRIILALLALGLMLSACSTETSTSENGSTPVAGMEVGTATVENPATNTPESTATPEVQLDIQTIMHDQFYYGQDEIAAIPDLHLGERTINGTEYDVILGKDSSGNEKIWGAEMTTYTGKKVWTRISITDLGGDNGKMILWINPTQDGAIQVNDETAEVVKDFLFKVVRDGGQGASIDNMTGGKITLETPYAYNEIGGPDVAWEGKTLDLQNVEIRIIESQADWKDFAQNYQELAKKMFSSSYGRNGAGVYMNPKENAGTIVVMLQTNWNADTEKIWNGNEPIVDSSDESLIRASIEEGAFYPYFWVALSTFAYYPAGKGAFRQAGNGENRINYPFSMVKGSFDIMPAGFVESIPRK